MFEGKAKSLPPVRVEHPNLSFFKVFHLGKLRPWFQTLDMAETNTLAYPSRVSVTKTLILGWCKTRLHRNSRLKWFVYPFALIVAAIFMKSAEKVI
jgi:hypothetical protein